MQYSKALKNYRVIFCPRTFWISGSVFRCAKFISSPRNQYKIPKPNVAMNITSFVSLSTEEILKPSPTTYKVASFQLLRGALYKLSSPKKTFKSHVYTNTKKNLTKTTRNPPCFLCCIHGKRSCGGSTTCEPRSVWHRVSHYPSCCRVPRIPQYNKEARPREQSDRGWFFPLGNIRRLYWLRERHGANLHNLESIEAGEYGVNRISCFVASFLEVIAVAGLLLISWCVWVRRIFSRFFSICFSLPTHPACCKYGATLFHLLLYYYKSLPPRQIIMCVPFVCHTAELFFLTVICSKGGATR